MKNDKNKENVIGQQVVYSSYNSSCESTEKIVDDFAHGMFDQLSSTILRYHAQFDLWNIYSLIALEISIM